MQFSITLVFLSLLWEVTISEMGWLGPILNTKLISVVLCFTAAIGGQMKYLGASKIRENDFPTKWTFDLH